MFIILLQAALNMTNFALFCFRTQADWRYEVSQDVRGQLKFLEELDRVERRRHDEVERELLLRAAKSRSKSEDPEQAKLKAKAKEVRALLVLQRRKARPS